MALFTIRRAEVQHNGRIVRFWFGCNPKPNKVGWPDWRPAWIRGGRLTLSGGRTLKPLGQVSNDFTMPPTHMASYVGAGVVPPGEYYSRVALVNSQGIETDLSGLGAGWGSGPASPSRSWGISVSATQELSVFIPDRVPDGFTGNLYLSTAPGQPPTGLRLWKSGLQPGTRKVVIDKFEFADMNKEVPQVWGWIMDWMIEDPNEIITFGESIVANAPLGIGEDDLGNVTQALVDLPVVNYSWMDSTGFSKPDFPLGSNGRCFYISANGNNSNDGLTPQTPLKTLLKLETVAASEIAKLQGGGCHVKLRRGDTFYESSVRLGRGWGQDFAHPLILESYWDPSEGPDPGTRPIVSNSLLDSPLLFQTTNNSPVPGPPKCVIIRGIHLKCNNALGNYPVLALKQYLGGDHWLIEDVMSEGWAINLAVDGNPAANWGAYGRHITYHRCIIIDSDGRGYGPSPTGVFVQGTHCDYGSEFLVSQCFMHNNGYYNKAADLGNIFSHSNYWNFGMHYQTAWGNFILDGGSHGIHYRGGGTCAHNVIAQQSIGCEMNLFGGTMAKNIFINMRDIPNGTVLNISAAFSAGTPIKGNGLFEENFVLQAGGRGDCRALLSGIYAEVPGAGHAVRYGMFIERNNTYYQSGPRSWNENFPDPCRRRRNLHVCTTSFTLQLLRCERVATFINWDFLKSDYNLYNSAITKYVGGIPYVTTLQNWRNTTAEDMNSIEASVNFSQPSFGLDQVAVAKGWINHADMVQGNRTRGLRVWDQRFGTEGVWDAFSEAFRPTNLSEVDPTPFEYYGAKDYRTPPALTYTMSGPSVAQRGSTSTFFVQPSGTSTDVMQLSDAGMGGLFVPQSLVWNGESAVKSFDYTAHTPGLIVVSGGVSLIPAASQKVFISLGMRNGGRQSRPLSGQISNPIL